MSELFFKTKTVVVPGDVLAKGMDYFPGVGTYRNGEDIIATRIGLLTTEGKVLKLIPLAGGYIPKAGDVIISKVFDVTMSGWLMKTNTPYTAMLNVKDATNQFVAKGEDLTRYYSFGDYVVTKIYNVTSQKLVDLTMKGPGLKKLAGGQVIEVSPAKVPRLVGKAGSMVSMIKKATNCRIIVGQNGYVWVSGAPQAEVIAINTIKMIEHQAHVPGLTERIEKHLEEAVKGVDLGEPLPVEEDTFFSRPQRSFNRGYDRGGDRRGGYNRGGDRRGGYNRGGDRRGGFNRGGDRRQGNFNRGNNNDRRGFSDRGNRRPPQRRD